MGGGGGGVPQWFGVKVAVTSRLSWDSLSLLQGKVSCRDTEMMNLPLDMKRILQ